MALPKLDWKEMLVVGLLGPIEATLTQYFYQIFSSIQPVSARKQTLLSLYPTVDVQLEDLAKKTKSKVDDSGINFLKTAIELAAEDIPNFELPNLDKGTKND